MGTVTDAARPTAKGKGTRTRILEVAEAAILAKGFDATSIEEIVAGAEITRSGFFYHFPDKNALARALIERYMAQDRALLDDIFRRAEELTDDPLHALLIGLKLFSEALADLPNGHPGCMVASICYQERLFDREVTEMVRQVTVDWNARFRGYLDDIADVHGLRPGLSTSDLAEALCCLVDGGILMAKIVNDAGKLERQILTYRQLVRMAFEPAAAVRRVNYSAIAAE
jgi:TetR/AcrR family transcriptional repressor of nem operon